MSKKHFYGRAAAELSFSEGILRTFTSPMPTAVGLLVTRLHATEDVGSTVPLAIDGRHARAARRPSVHVRLMRRCRATDESRFCVCVFCALLRPRSGR